MSTSTSEKYVGRYHHLILRLEIVLLEKRVKISRMIESKQNIGVVGLGRMGTAIANNILKSGFSLVVYNRTPDKTSSLVEAGATKAASPKDVAMKSDVVITSLREQNCRLITFC
jgi:lactate dehydrogenase-like 2-hydroxyacid dehydrogenase